MKITKKEELKSMPGPESWFSGVVNVQMLFGSEAPATAGGATVTFQPGARTVWHTHPLGQTLIITEGNGWVQKEGEAKQEVSAGDVVWFSPNEKHWHGASNESVMTHIAIQEALDGKAVDWMEQVSDEDYLK